LQIEVAHGALFTLQVAADGGLGEAR